MLAVKILKLDFSTPISRKKYYGLITVNDLLMCFTRNYVGLVGPANAGSSLEKEYENLVCGCSDLKSNLLQT